jgi:LysM repeat protein
MAINSVGGTGAAGPGGSSPENEGVATVRVGENTVSDVASRLGLDANTLLQANPQIKDPNQKLNAGQDIHLPQDPTETAKGTKSSGKAHHNDYMTVTMNDITVSKF